MNCEYDKVSSICGNFRFNKHGVCLNPESVIYASLSAIEWVCVELEIAHCSQGWIYGGSIPGRVAPCSIYGRQFVTKEECIDSGIKWLIKQCKGAISRGYDIQLNKKALTILRTTNYPKKQVFIQSELF